MPNPAPEPSMVELAEMTARRRAPSSPRRRQEARAQRRLAVAVALLGGSFLICLWLLLA